MLMSQDHEDDHETRLPDVGEAMPPIDFNTFILSLASATMIDLGEMEGPDGRRHAPNLAMARHHIDLLAMLQERQGTLERELRSMVRAPSVVGTRAGVKGGGV